MEFYPKEFVERAIEQEISVKLFNSNGLFGNYHSPVQQTELPHTLSLSSIQFIT